MAEYDFAPPEIITYETIRALTKHLRAYDVGWMARLLKKMYPRLSQSKARTRITNITQNVVRSQAQRRLFVNEGAALLEVYILEHRDLMSKVESIKKLDAEVSVEQ